MQDKSKHYNVLKFFTTILVVMAHSSRMYTGEGVVNPVNASSLLARFTQFIYSFHMPLFIAISGMVYGLCIDDLGKYADSLQFIKNKAARLLIPYVFFGLLYVAPVMVLCGFTNKTYPGYCLDGILLVRDARHLWYVIVLFEIFAGTIITKKIIQSRNAYLVLSVLIALLILALFADRLPVTFQINKVGYYLLFFYLGVLFNRYYKDVLQIIRKPLCVVLLLLITVILFVYFYRSLKVFLAITSGLVFTAIVSFVPKSFVENRHVARLNKNGFGIYLFHPMIIYVMFYYLGNKDINPLVLCFAVAMISYIVSSLATELFRKIHLGMLIGE